MSLPMSCMSAAHRRRYRSSSDSWSSSPRRSVKTRTRSACPRVRRSWDCSATESDRMVAAVRLSSRAEVSPRVSARRDSSFRTLPAVRAIEKRVGAWSGNNIESLSRVTRGRSRRPARSTPTATSSGAGQDARAPSRTTTVRAGEGIDPAEDAVAASEAPIGTSRMNRRRPAAKAGRDRQRLPVGVSSATFLYRAVGRPAGWSKGRVGAPARAYDFGPMPRPSAVPEPARGSFRRGG